MTSLRTAAQQALTILEAWKHKGMWGDWDGVTDTLRAALAEPVQEPDLSRCPQCGGPADNGHDRSIPPNPYWCTKCMAEPVPDSKHATIAEWWADKQRKPLTDGQIHDCFQQKHKDKVTERRMIARAIERAHGIKDA